MSKATLSPLGIGKAILFAAAIVLAGCGPSEDTRTQEEHSHDHDHEDGHDHDHGEDRAHGEDEGEEKHGHHHSAPHGGTLVALGDHFAHVEFVLNSDTGELAAYFLDGEAEGAVRLEQPNVTVEIEHSAGGTERGFEIALNGVANELTGETVGDTSEFRGTSEWLAGVSEFEGTIRAVTVKGSAHENVEFEFPEGNE